MAIIEKEKALDVVRQMVADGQVSQEVAEKYFPELAESEEEKIRKHLIGVVELYYGNTDEQEKKDCLAWLERQGEKGTNGNEREIPISDQDLTGKVEQKFKVGNKIKLSKEPKYPARKIIAIQNDAYYFDEVVYLPFNRQDEWELVEQKPVFEMKTQEESLGVDSDTYSKIVDECVYGEQKPADKKGMNLVEEEMTPFQKKVFCIIDTTIEEEQGLKQVCDELLRLAHDEIIQNTAWSEEDRRMLIGLIDELDAIMNKATPNEISVYSKYINWLKSIRPKNTWKPSGEQIEYLAKAIATLGDEGNCKTASILNYLRVELKKLREE